MTHSALARTAAVFAASVALVAVSALPALAVEPGDGAVIFNPDGTPIGSELTYGLVGGPQYFYTSQTNDDDYWGLDIDGEPEHPMSSQVVSGIPIGFDVKLGGLTLNEIVVNSNGSVCLASSTVNPVTSPEFGCWYYDVPPAILADPSFSAPSQSLAMFTILGNDQDPGVDQPIDAVGSDGINDSCEQGGYYFADIDVCSSVFWGATTYEGKSAFSATWYHNPDYADVDLGSTYQLVLVDEGDGNVTVVYNYDQVEGFGYELDYGWKDNTGNTLPLSTECMAAWDAGDENEYIAIGASSQSTTDSTANVAVDLFGAACVGGATPTIATALVDGGASALSTHSLNSTVAGRYVWSVTDGIPSIAAVVIPAAVPTLPETGAPAASVLTAGGVLLALGALLVLLRARGTRAGYSRSGE